MKLIVGLGNPGETYKLTRHNIGFLAIDALVKTFDAQKVGKKFKSIVYKAKIEDEDFLLVKPQTFMNLSGEAVQLIMGFYKLKPTDLVVIYDDFDLDFNTLRLRGAGSAGTHNGMKSIVQLLGTKSFPRLRVGIGPKPPYFETSDFVLSTFSKEEQKEIPTLLEKIASCVELLGAQTFEAVMNVTNQKS